MTDTDKARYAEKLIRLCGPTSLESIRDRIICQDLFDIIDWLPGNSIDLLFADPPYNLTKEFNGLTFKQITIDNYEKWLDSWLAPMVRVLKPTASVYICGDWRSSAAIHKVCETYFNVQNRITWEREKGRGSQSNWKNNSEDIWFCTMMKSRYTFNVNDVKLKRKVIAPYRDASGKPKDWDEQATGNFRITYPSNMWTDISVPFWSMPENTAHPTQKPEKLAAKIILAASNKGDIVFDPFVGSGTTAVVAKKLERHFIGVDINEDYGCLAVKRLEMVAGNRRIQGYEDGVFWERNVLKEFPGGARSKPKRSRKAVEQPDLLPLTDE